MGCSNAYGAQAKPYHVKQVRSVILKAKLGSRP
jgi:hypothetical protein